MKKGVCHVFQLELLVYFQKHGNYKEEDDQDKDGAIMLHMLGTDKLKQCT